MTVDRRQRHEPGVGPSAAAVPRGTRLDARLSRRRAGSVRFVAPPSGRSPAPLARLRLRPADRALVRRRASRSPAASRSSSTAARRTCWRCRARGPIGDARAGRRGRPRRCCRRARPSAGRTPARATGHGCCTSGPTGIARVALGRSPQIVASPVDGRRSRRSRRGPLAIRADGRRHRGPLGWGQPVHGRLMLGGPSPDAELRASAIDIAAAGSILVAGRPAGHRGAHPRAGHRRRGHHLRRPRGPGAAPAGGVGRRASAPSLHATAPFAVLALDGYGRRIVPDPSPGSCWWPPRADPSGLLPDRARGHRRRPGHAGRCPSTSRTPCASRRARAPAGLARLVGLAGPCGARAACTCPCGFIEETGRGRRRPRAGSCRCPTWSGLA